MISSSFPSASVQHTSFCLFSESSLNMASNSFWASSASSSTTNFISWSFWDVILGTQTVKFGSRPMCTSHAEHVHNWTELQYHLYTPILPSTGGPRTDIYTWKTSIWWWQAGLHSKGTRVCAASDQHILWVIHKTLSIINITTIFSSMYFKVLTSRDKSDTNSLGASISEPFLANYICLLFVCLLTCSSFAKQLLGWFC